MKGKIPLERSAGTVSVPDRLRVLDETQLHAVLATYWEGRPHTSLVAFALTPDVKGLLFATPKKTLKYRNILKNSSVSVLIDTRANAESDYLNAEAVSINGNATPIRRGRRWEELSDIFLRKHHGLTGFVRSPSSALILVKAVICYHVGSFQTISEWKVE
jgi:nitroimidazol reductase NimA-like FMN-containing flavoprotein (pyridoxamine 5'-phosphate oxidase superfamily)